jgi:hypothetical protein
LSIGWLDWISILDPEIIYYGLSPVHSSPSSLYFSLLSLEIFVSIDRLFIQKERLPGGGSEERNNRRHVFLGPKSVVVTAYCSTGYSELKVHKGKLVMRRFSDGRAWLSSDVLTTGPCPPGVPVGIEAGVHGAARILCEGACLRKAQWRFNGQIEMIMGFHIGAVGVLRQVSAINMILYHYHLISLVMVLHGGYLYPD